ncbi:hypothetical protein I4U23_027194 [Adineta vaga]|nr:hypothetical protein I4U23_027194 [Adineta vaga]
MKWKSNENQGEIIAGKNGKGCGLDQLSNVSFIFVDDEQSIYVSDSENHRIMKWRKDAKEGVIVAGGNGWENQSNQVSYPVDLSFDDEGNLYVADYGNHRIERPINIMVDENISEEISNLLYELIDEIDAIYECDDCSIVDSTVKRQIKSQQTTTEATMVSYLCDNCVEKRHINAQKVLQDLESLAYEVEQRLKAIENTEKELDQWRDAQLQKNREFWDEYRRQVENFSSCRIRTLQYEYTMRQLKTERIRKRLKRAKYIGEHIYELSDQLNHLFPLSFINLISSEQFQNQFSLFLSNKEENSTNEQRKEFLDQLEQLAFLDQIIIPGDQFGIDDEIKDDFDE